MSNLLQVVRVNPKAAGKKGNMPLIMEFQVHPDTAPYLVTSTKGLLWIDAPHPGPAENVSIVKAAVREIEAPGDLFWAMVLSVIQRGRRDSWGNVHPFTKEGVLAAATHLEDYDLGDLEILAPRVRVNSKDDKGNVIENKDGIYKRPGWLHPEKLGYPVRPSSWVPDDCVVVLPRDREFVGLLSHLGPRTVAAAAHNPSRSIAVAWDGDELAG